MSTDEVTETETQHKERINRQIMDQMIRMQIPHRTAPKETVVGNQNRSLSHMAETAQ